jgi:hypothetical protein
VVKGKEMTESTTLATLYCTNHPDRETMLRCNKCDKPICYECAVRTPVGYRCRECVREQQNVYYNAEKSDVLIGGIVALVLGVGFGILAYITLGLMRLVPAGSLFAIIGAVFIGPAVGGLIAEAIRRAVNKRRARAMKWVAAGAFLAGVLAPAVLLFGLQALLIFWVVLLAAGLAASTLYARLL